MTDQANTEELDSGITQEQETPEQPEKAQDGPDYESQYNELRSDYTKKTQRLSETERLISALQSRDPDQQAEALQELGLLEEQEEEVDDPDDPFSAYEARLARLEQEREKTRASHEEEQAVEKEVEFLDQALSAVEKKIGRELSDEEVRLYGYVATQNRNEEGLPDVEQAHKLIEDLTTQRIEQWRASKNTPQVMTGKPGESKLDFDDPDVRARYIAAKLKAGAGAQG